MNNSSFSLPFSSITVFPDIVWFKKAAELYLKAATLGNSDAQWSIALCYKDGDGVEKDWGQAFNWMKKCAESGNDNGIKYLGDFYFNGVGVERDIKKAYECYMKLSNLSISQGTMSMFVRPSSAISLTPQQETAYSAD